MATSQAQRWDWNGLSAAAPVPALPRYADPAPMPDTEGYQVLKGASRDSRARKGVSASIANAFRFALLVGACIFVLGLVRVGMCAATVSTLEANNSLKQEVSSAQDTNRQLKIEINSLSSNARIAKLATQKYNMVYAGAGETLHVDLSQK